MDKGLGSWSIKGNLVNNGRCPKCTLKIPCKHYQSVDELPSVVEKRSPRLAMKALPPLPPPTKEQENIVPMIAPAANAEKK